MKKLILSLLSVLICLQTQAFVMAKTNGDEQPDSVRAYLKNALDLLKNRAVNKNKLDWNQIYKQAYAEAANAKTIRATYPVIVKTLSLLQDHHSNFFPPEQVAGLLLGYRKTGQEFPKIEARMLDDGYAYLNLPPIGCYNFEDWDEYVNSFHQEIYRLQQQHPKGWIIDLRGNYGGMFAPMYAAISPFLDQDQVIGWKDGTGTNHFLSYQKGSYKEDQTQIHEFRLSKIKIKPIRQPILLLTNRKTASSGEFAAISFVGQKNVTIIGERTNGLTSSNQEHKLADGAFLVITEGNTIDRNSKEYAKVGEGLNPALEIKDPDSISDTDYKLYFQDIARKRKL